ncbi:hypothetical protein EDD18DRAFT_1359632 [Armillaria luteobubalina]|uniref:DUF6589 domain-containing protein n=1 Tax=Armillaria luteobubalina TaxID=153913 RepID=A0AA39PSE1_9AGAR|nr:hypothetical protein EDD18DRAFT_1359632 [Armillaria luteobubalina]
MTSASLKNLCSDVALQISSKEVRWCFVLDNVQQYTVVQEHGIGWENVLKAGMAATAIHLDDFAPGAFNIDDYLSQVIQNNRKTMTTESLYSDIAWQHIESTLALHWACVLCDFVPVLHFLLPEITNQFQSAPHARHRMHPGRRTEVQALRTNAEQEVTVQGMHQAILDFKTQAGFTPESAEHSLTWFQGDRASYATMNLCKLYLGPASLQNWDSLRDVISTPEIWHADATMVRTIASNHYGPSTSSDPSSLSCNSNTANMKRPTDLKKPDYYPTTCAMTLMWDAHVLDCCRVHFCFETNLVDHFEDLSHKNKLLTLEKLLKEISVLVARYSSLNGYEQVQLLAATSSSTDRMKIHCGSPWIPPVPGTNKSNNNTPPESLHGVKEETPPSFIETEGFDGD